MHVCFQDSKLWDSVPLLLTWPVLGPAGPGQPPLQALEALEEEPVAAVVSDF